MRWATKGDRHDGCFTDGAMSMPEDTRFDAALAAAWVIAGFAKGDVSPLVLAKITYAVLDAIYASEARLTERHGQAQSRYDAHVTWLD